MTYSVACAHLFFLSSLDSTFLSVTDVSFSPHLTTSRLITLTITNESEYMNKQNARDTSCLCLPKDGAWRSGEAACDWGSIRCFVVLCRFLAVALYDSYLFEDDESCHVTRWEFQNYEFTARPGALNLRESGSLSFATRTSMNMATKTEPDVTRTLCHPWSSQVGLSKVEMSIRWPIK